ncbi:hypothetical protein D9M73_277360 [compost metagenome]
MKVSVESMVFSRAPICPRTLSIWLLAASRLLKATPVASRIALLPPGVSAPFSSALRSSDTVSSMPRFSFAGSRLMVNSSPAAGLPSTMTLTPP